MTDFLSPIDEDLPELPPGNSQGGGQMMPTETRIGDVVSMRRAAMLMPRKPAEVRRLIAEAAEMFGDAWEYRFPVKNNRTGQTDWIEGPTIGCTMAVARAYGNNDVAHTRTEDEGNSWVLYSTFLDMQSGFSLTRGFRQRKGQSRMGSDRSRGEDIDFQIGVSKSTRNVVARALDDYVQYARQCARHRLSGSISKRPDEYRERIKSYLDEVGYPLKAIEGALGGKLNEWKPEQIATVVRTLTAHKDGILRDLDDVYQPKAADAEAKPQDAIQRPADARTAPRQQERTPTPAEPASSPSEQQAQAEKFIAGQPAVTENDERRAADLARDLNIPKRRGRPPKAETEARHIIAAIMASDPEYVQTVVKANQAEIDALPQEWQDDIGAAAQAREAERIEPEPVRHDPETGEVEPESGDGSSDAEPTPEDDDFVIWKQEMRELVRNIPRDLRPARKGHWLRDAEQWGERGKEAVEEAFGS